MKLSPEQIVQAQCVDFTLRFCPSVLLSASQNGLYLGSGRWVGAYIEQQKKLGMLPGELDLMLTWNDKNILFIEMKAGKNPTTDNQDKVMKIRRSQGFDCEVAHSLDEYFQYLRTYGVPIRSGIYAGLGQV